MKPLHLSLLLCGLFLVSGGPTARAQAGPEKGGHELQIWTSGGYGVKGIALHTGVWNAGLLYGWVLTAPHGPGFLRGQLEYAAEVAPVFLLFQSANTAYGVAVSPLTLKWNFHTHGRVVPYVNISAGPLFTNHETPPGTSRTNFTSSSALGMHFVGGKFTWSTDVRFMHISNFGLASANPGINVLQLRLGVGLFRGRHHKT